MVEVVEVDPLILALQVFLVYQALEVEEAVAVAPLRSPRQMAPSLVAGVGVEVGVVGRQRN